MNLSTANFWLVNNNLFRTKGIKKAMWGQRVFCVAAQILSLAAISRIAVCLAKDTHPTERFAIKETIQSESAPPIHGAFYTRSTGEELLGPANLSINGGKTWKEFRSAPDFASNLPFGYRRELFPGVLDPKTGRIVTVLNAMDTPGLDPKSSEPAISRTTYYLRYRVSTDAGRTNLFDEPIVQSGHKESNPFDGVWIGKNGILMGDIGSAPIFTRDGNLLVPASVFVLGKDGKLADLGGGETYEDVLVLIGTWGKDNRLVWNVSQRVKGNPKRTTRGLSEPTLAELSDGKILMVMRGSNGGSKDKDFKIPSYKWMSFSKDQGHSWSQPKPWTFDSGKSFFSPSSMSQLLSHSSGRVFWIGNINPTNSQRNNWRWPLVIGEVDVKTLQLIEASLLMIDTRHGDDPNQLDISHFRAIEDRQTGDIMLTAPRYFDGYKSGRWTYFRIGILQ